MKARRTPWWHYVVAALLGLAAGAGLAAYGESSGLALIGVPWFVPVLLMLLGVIVLALAIQVHRYATTEPAKRRGRSMDPERAVATLMLCKALGLAGAALTGWYAGQIILSISHIEASYYAHAVAQCAVAAVVCLIDMIIGIVGEGLCKLPPSEGPENPKLKEMQRRASLASAAAKTSN